MRGESRAQVGGAEGFKLLIQPYKTTINFFQRRENIISSNFVALHVRVYRSCDAVTLAENGFGSEIVCVENMYVRL